MSWLADFKAASRIGAAASRSSSSASAWRTVAGVLAFSVSGRTREFGIRLAVGSEPRRLVAGVLAAAIVASVVPALRAARVDVMQALRSD